MVLAVLALAVLVLADSVTINMFVGNKERLKRKIIRKQRNDFTGAERLLLT